MYVLNLPEVLDEKLLEELLNHYIKTKDNTVKETIILHNLRLVSYIANRYKSDTNPLRAYDDLFNEGVIGLINGLNTYDPEKGTFKNHIAIYIKASIRAYIRDKASGLRVPSWLYETLYKVESFKRDFYNKYQREPTIQEISDILDIKYSKLEKILSINRKVSSLDIVITGEDSEYSIGEVIKDDNINIEDDVISSVFIDSFLKSIEDNLKEDEIEALRLNLGLNCMEYQMTEVSKILNRSYQDSVNLKNQAIKKIRKSSYGMQLIRELDEITPWYTSPKYSDKGIRGEYYESPVERLVLMREQRLKKMEKWE